MIDGFMTEQDAVRIFREQLIERIGTERAAKLRIVSGNVSGGRFFIGVMSGSDGYGYPIAETGPHPNCVLTNTPLPVDSIVKWMKEEGVI